MARVQRQAIDQDEFNETAERLKAEGKKVSAVTMRQALGGGSYDTIYKYLGIWEARTPAAVIKVEPQVIPPSVQAGFANAWRLATEAAAAEIIAIKEKCSEEVSAALAQFHGALEAIGKLEAESEVDAQEIERLTGKVTEVENAFYELQKEAAGQNSLLEQLQKLTEKQEKVIEGLREESAKASELRGTVATLQEQNDKLMQNLSKEKTK